MAKERSDERVLGPRSHDDLAEPVFRDQLSFLNGRVFDPAEDKTRQEDKDAADINQLLFRHGVGDRVPQYGSFDFDLDLHSAYQIVGELRSGYDKLPDDVRSKFGDFPSVMKGIADGSLVMHEGRITVKADIPPVAPPVSDVPKS